MTAPVLSLRERGELINVARLYYEENLTQVAISQRLGVSRPLVSKLLQRAREAGIVHIEIRTGGEGDYSLLKNLQAKYALAGGAVLDTGAQDKQSAFWQQAALYLATELRAERNIGLGWGRAVAQTVQALAELGGHSQEGAVYPLIGNGHLCHTDALARRLGEATGRMPYALQCPALHASYEEREAYESSAACGEVSSLWQQTDVAIIGIKSYPNVPDEGTAMRFGDALLKQKAVGCFLSYYYNARGEFISGNNDFCLHMPLPLLRRCRKVIAIAAHEGAQAISGALKTGLITHIILPASAAKKLAGQ